MELASGESVCKTKFEHAVPYAKEKEKACVTGLKYGYSHFKPIVKKHW